MPDLNKEALAIWESLKPAIDKEIERKTAGMVQRRKVVVSTAPSSATGLVGVHEPFAPEFFVPFRSEVSEAVPGDPIWIEFAYGANNAVAIGMASLIDDDTPSTGRSVSATLSSSGWYRVMTTIDAGGTVFEFTIGRPYGSGAAQAHKIDFFMVGGGKSTFTNELSDANNLYIDKIRCTYGGGYVHFDIHYNTSGTNDVYVDFNVKGNHTMVVASVSENLVSVADAPVGETVLITHEFAATSKTPVEYGTANGWDYVVYADKTIEATKVVSSSMSYYTTVGPFYGYYQVVNTPFTMANTSYYVGASWRIGSGYGIPAGFQQMQTTRFNAYALGTAHGTSENFELYLFLKGTIA